MTSVRRPSVVLESPKRGVVVPWGTDVSIKAVTKDIDAPAVEFRANDEMIGRDVAAPFEIVHRPGVPGPVTLTVQVRDASGNVIASDAVRIDVQNPNPSGPTDELTDQDYAVGMLGPQPLVTLTSPSDAAVITGRDLQLAAEASGTAAGLVRVEFLVDGVSTGTRTMAATEPQAIVRFEYQWKAGPGTHTIVARAIDVAGRVGTSKTATIAVQGATH